MEAGATGHPGLPVPKHVKEEVSQGLDLATILLLQMEARIVVDQLVTVKHVIHKLAQVKIKYLSI